MPISSATDPFHERSTGLHRRHLHLLGAQVRFESNSDRLLRLVDQAFAGLSPHQLFAETPRLRVRLQLMPRAHRNPAREPPLMKMFAAPGLLCGAMDESNLAVVSPAQRSALVVISRDMLRHPYHARYELIEFAVYMLAARAQGLVPLHAAAVGCEGRGLLLMGGSGAGKSTMALHCLLQGLELLSEDSVFVTPGGLMATGIANFLHLHPQGLRFLRGHHSAERIRSSPMIRRRSGAEKYELDLRHADYRLASAPLTVQAVVFLSTRRAGDRRLLVPVPRRELAARLAAQQPYASGQQGWHTFTRRLSGVRAFELHRGSHPRVAVEVLRGLLDVPVRRTRRA
ncbi:MAG: serine kinase [Steroidobacterales bacterium]